MSDSEELDRHSSTRLVLAVVFCVVMYFLSAGPVVWLAEHGYISHTNSFLEAFYAPGRWLLMRSELLTEFFMGYLRLWGAPI
jgi:hypothetical protein